MKTIICYSDKSSVTGKALREKFEALRKRTDKRSKCDVFLRWGSTEQFTRVTSKLVLNTFEAVAKTANKLRMIQILSTAGIPTPKFSTTLGLADLQSDTEGNYYIRNKYGVVRYANNFGTNDLYATTPVLNKRREYRVHVFDGKVIGIYEKVPMGETRPLLFKSDTCNFVRCNPENCRLTLANQATCIQAVAALGLLFGGVDIIRDKNQNIFICEVNSAPGLNTQMLDKYAQEITTYVESNLPV